MRSVGKVIDGTKRVWYVECTCSKTTVRTVRTDRMGMQRRKDMVKNKETREFIV